MKYLHRISILYLALPFVLFLFGWVRLTIAIPLAIILLFALWRVVNQSPVSNPQFSNPPITIYHLLVIGAWALLSGVGGYAFQNWDHHWRNAVFHDLINFDFPVYYSQPESGPVKMLVYYVGYWLPAARIGKLLGWQAANFALFLWTLLGLLLVTYHLASALKTSPVKATLLLIFFSGLDALGVLLLPKDYPTLLPPITHLEIWSGTQLQYSSFTTQLFWVFNQAVPAWLVISVIARSEATKQSKANLEIASGTPSCVRCREEQERPRNDVRSEFILLWALCFFFAPLAAVGLLPYVLIEFIKDTDFKSPFKNLRWEVLLSAAIILLLSTFYFSSNTSAQQRGLQSIPFADFLAFFLLEGGILWLALASVKWRDPRWVVTGLLLLLIPFIQLGSGRDFVMRASIAPLFYLMLMTGETVFNKTTPRLLLVTCYLLLALGALTSLYEINRSVYRTFDYYFLQPEDCSCDVPSSEPVTHLAPPGIPEKEHPDSLTADAIPTLKFMTDELSQNFIANVRRTLYYRYIAPR
ncbi:MAG: hypothetical protein HND47_04750 [Chloroflexi bacterium]|nr:hypothetical protein [Chloroflexota bacterium]